ncbi:hypothetical protein ENSA5_33210 [Enhygromyxa salina]|uniref:Uncharacterized protein n=1 Tax=Enhygromyxa salina TaxID=215803 RepID=A0A2S9XXF7_9BACT|nr:hypothetical protein ENSA5_33210 [Enhygromyxa salina]
MGRGADWIAAMVHRSQVNHAFSWALVAALGLGPAACDFDTPPRERYMSRLYVGVSLSFEREEGNSTSCMWAGTPGKPHVVWHRVRTPRQYEVRAR